MQFRRLSILVVCVAALPAFAHLTASRSTEEATVALNRAKQSVLATLIYCADYDDVFPYAQSTETAKAVMRPYARLKETFDSPTKGGKFVFNVNVGGVIQRDIPSPKDVPVWVEQLPNSADAPAVGYADGHAKLIQAANRKQLAAALKQKLPRQKGAKPLPKNWRG